MLAIHINIQPDHLITDRFHFITHATQPADFRMEIDGLAALYHSRLTHAPRCGILFVFINRNKTMNLTLAYDGNGFWLMTRRLSKGKFQC